ncbi:MAG TPA: MFS transporter, partial [Chloroflexota bacterium]
MDAQPRTPVASASTWRALLPLCLVVFAVMVHASAIGPLAVAMARDLGVSIPLIGQVSTLILAAVAAAGLLAGPLADHLGHRRTLLLALATLVASAAIMGLAPTYPVLLAGGLVAGIGATVLGV